MLTQNYTTKQQLRPYIEQLASPINVQDYLKSISDTQIVTIESLVKEMISNNKTATTLTELQFLQQWNAPNGIAPSRAHEWEDILALIENNPEETFSIADVWCNTSLIYVIKKFNRFPDLTKSISNLKFHGGFYWEALDTPTFYIVKMLVNGKMEYVLISTIGGHRVAKMVLTSGYGSEIPLRIIYTGSLEIGSVAKRAAYLHHIDCNKRANQSAEDRIASGVEAEDYAFTQVMEALIDCKLYVDSDQMDSTKTKGFRKCSSWQNFKSAIKDNDYENVKYAVEKLQQYTNDPDVILAQSAEAIARFRMCFDKVIQRQSDDKDTLDRFLNHYFKQFCLTQKDVRSTGKVVDDTLELVNLFNRFAKGQLGKTKVPITSKNVMDAFGEEVEVSAK